MPFLIYDENRRQQGSKAFRIEEFDAVKHYLTHFANSMELSFFLQHGSREEKQQASKELAVAERKMAFWRKAPQFDMKDAERGIAEIKRRWNQ